MKVYHQLGANYKWNIDCFNQNIGDGLIFSPVNIDSDKLIGFESKLKETGFLDPQLYLLNEVKGTLDTYPYFPGNIKFDFSTIDLDSQNLQVAKLCVDYQMQNNFQYLIIPTRYNEVNPTNFYEQSSEHFVIPFCDYIKSINTNKTILLTVIVKKDILIDIDKRNDILNWITGHLNINGVYLIFESNFSSKQIKDFDYLYNALHFIKILKDNQLQIHIGYTNNEALLYSIAMPDSITIGSYENVRNFGVKRFQEAEKTQMRSPNARLYSSKLLQWVDYGYIQSMKKLVENYANYFDNSDFNPLDFKPEVNWQFKKTEPYKHYFYVFDKQIKNLPQEQNERIERLKETLISAINLFKKIENDVFLDNNSDGSHLPMWLNVLNSFQKDIKL